MGQLNYGGGLAYDHYISSYYFNQLGTVSLNGQLGKLIGQDKRWNLTSNLYLAIPNKFKRSVYYSPTEQVEVKQIVTFAALDLGLTKMIGQESNYSQKGYFGYFNIGGIYAGVKTLGQQNDIVNHNIGENGNFSSSPGLSIKLGAGHVEKIDDFILQINAGYSVNGFLIDPNNTIYKLLGSGSIQVCAKLIFLKIPVNRNPY